MSTANLLPCTLEVPGAVMLGLGSILGTGVFVSLGLAAGIAEPGGLRALGLAAFIALCNALSSAQLAAAHSVSRGTYEYGCLYLGPRWGFTAGWLFLCAKSASAATSALGVAGYFLHAVGLTEPSLGVPLALIALEAFVANELPNTGLVARGSGAIGRGEWQ